MITILKLWLETIKNLFVLLVMFLVKKLALEKLSTLLSGLYYAIIKIIKIYSLESKV